MAKLTLEQIKQRLKGINRIQFQIIMYVYDNCRKQDDVRIPPFCKVPTTLMNTKDIYDHIYPIIHKKLIFAWRPEGFYIPPPGTPTPDTGYYMGEAGIELLKDLDLIGEDKTLKRNTLVKNLFSTKYLNKPPH